MTEHDGAITRRDFVEHAALLSVGLGLFPGLARVRLDSGTLSLTTDGVEGTWTTEGGSFRPVALRDRLSGRPIPVAREVFVLELQDGSSLPASRMRMRRGPRSEKLPVDERAARFADRLPGTRLVLDLEDPDSGLRVEWSAIGRQGSKYLRQEIVLSPTKRAVPVKSIVLIDVALPRAAVLGSVRGSPIVTGDVYLGFEHPLSEASLDGERARAVLPRDLPLRPGTTFTVSSVVGSTPPGQLRRAFLEYVERERAHPYRTFLHYNSWYDLGFFNRYGEAGALDRIRAFGQELHEKRGVTLDSFLFDDGWDDPTTLWHFDSGFPDGFTNVRKAAERYGAEPGVWMSPWGGYGKPREERLKYGREHGLEIDANGLALSGPKYFKLFHDTCVEFIRAYGVNQFKFDGTGNAAHVVADSKFDSDFDAMIALIGDLRRIEPDLYVNLTTGTYPSPFWLRYCDSIWRGGDDHSFAGVGTQRQQWITYRDGDTHAGIVEKGPLYPLNSLMLHGLIYARYANGLKTDPHHDFRSEIHDYFGTGTQLQEMYITPSLLSDENWNDLAQAAIWSRSNADTLVDTHWIGGDPLELEPYGWASWSPRKGILVLRNPSDRPQSMEVDVGEAFELPEGAPRAYGVTSPWERGESPLRLEAGVPHVFRLEPFEVLTLDGGAAGSA